MATIISVLVIGFVVFAVIGMCLLQYTNTYSYPHFCEAKGMDYAGWDSGYLKCCKLVESQPECTYHDVGLNINP